MALQLTGAAKSDSIANLTIRLPVVVIGGGLTAIDTATEALAYYPLQVERFLTRYETLVAERGEPSVRAAWSADEADIADEFVAHARAIRQARDIAKQEMREFYVSDLLREWGGVTVAYRRQMRQSPSYTLNHEEVAKALEEGIRFAEGLTPRSVSVDSAGHAQSITFASAAAQAGQSSGEPPHDVTLPARTILVAAGTQPNTLLHREDPSNAPLDGRYFRACDDEGRPVSPERSAKPAQAHVLMQVRPDGRAVSFFGDLHPSFSGNVVKAMASAKQGYPVITRLLSKQNAPVGSHETASRSSLGELNGWLGAHVREVRRLTPNIVEVVLHAPSAALAFRPGQFFRLQNYETNAIRVHDTTLAMEGLALTGAWVDREEGLISTIVLEMGGSSNLCALLKPGEPVVLMGPTGTPTEIPSGETVVLAGGGLGNAVLFSIGQALREAGSRVLYFAGYKSVVDRYYAEEIEKAADVVVWCCDEAPGFAPARLLDKTFVGNIVAAMHAYGSGQLGEMPIRLAEADRVIAIGSAGMMAAVAQARKGALAEYMQADHVAIGSINSPMQCMMKEICGQCLQVQNDPRTGLQTVVFSCCNQDQPLDWVDFRSLQQRLEQNATQEKLARMWIDRCLAAA
jgi:NAD(P)H-flavin reductase